MTPRSTNPPGGNPRWAGGLTLIEVIGVLAVMAILAGVLLPAWLASADKAASDLETATLQSFADALQRSILRSRSIPGPTGTTPNWVTTIATEAGLSVSAVATNSRNQARAFLIDTNGFSPWSLPTNQPSGGLAAPLPNPRLMIVSSLGLALPSNLTPKSADFYQLWNAVPGTVPFYTGSPWTGWNGKPADVLVQRINLSPLFVNLVLSSYQSTNTAYYALDTNAWLALAPGSASTNCYLRNSELKLFNGPSTNLDSHQILNGNTTLYYYENVWCSQLLAINNNNYAPTDPSLMSLWQNMITLANGFLYADNTGAAVSQSDLVHDFMAYFNAYIAWANENATSATTWPQDALYIQAVANYNNLVSDLNAFVNPLGIPAQKQK